MLAQQINQPAAGSGLKDTESIEALFSAVTGLVCDGAFSGIVDLSEAIFNQLMGNSDANNPNYTAALNQLSSQMSSLQNYLKNLATSVVYQEECFNITSTITGMESMLAQPAANLDYEQIVSMCTFLSPGASTLNQPDYQSAINDLLIATYGADVTIQTLQANTAPALGMNTSCEAFTIASDGAGSGGQGFYDFVQAQVSLSVAVSIMIVSITNTANKVYTCLSNASNKQIWLNEFTDQTFQEIFTSTLTGPSMLEEVSNPAASTYVTTVLGSCLVNAPQSLCGYFLNMVADMNANVQKANSANTSFTLINPNATNSYSYSAKYTPIISLNNNVLCYGPLSQNSYLTPSYCNNQPGNQLLLEGPSLVAGQNNYYFTNPEGALVGTTYPGGYPDANAYVFELMVYMPSLNKLYCIFNNPASNLAIGNTLFTVYGEIPCLYPVSYDPTNPNQHFQLQFQSGNG
jgi:hypothetical protein